MTIHGSCHCGKVRYSLAGDAPKQAIACNCSICRRKGSLLAFTAPENFTLETPREALAAYSFNTHNIQHLFCKTCGCAPFGEGSGPDGQATIALNLRCAEDLDLSELEIQPYDGAAL
ncbi:MAG: GFA family protein [Rhodovibrionaceae bacterium]